MHDQKKSFISFSQLLALSFVVLGTCFAAGPTHAQSEGVHTRIHHHYQSVRALGMGDAFTAAADDYSAIFYNPAFLARREEFQINMSMAVAGSQSFSDFYSDLDKAGAVTGTEEDKFTAYANLLQKYYGKNFMIRLGLAEGIFVRRKFGFALLPADITLEYKVHNQAAPALNARLYADSTAAFAYGDDILGVLPGRLSWGTTVKFVNRVYLNKQVNAANLAADSKAISDSELREGYGLDADLGFLYTPAIPGDGFWSVFKLAKPAFSVVARNVAESGFKSSLKLVNKDSGTLDAPEKMYRVFDLGTKWEYPEVLLFRGRGTMDFRDIGHPNFNSRKSFHLGFEFDWRVTSLWKGAYRIGVNQNYPTLGASAQLLWFNLDVATWGEDVGSFDSPKENRMYAAKFNMVF